jgi:NAD(P)-dependent dehydrogenase (short-subunit alcohol dehydrogenase family)
MEFLYLEGKNILVTGASSGIGRECAILLSRHKANVVLLGRDHQRLEETQSRMEGENHIIIAQDMTFPDIAESIVCIAYDKLGKLSGFVHSAGIEATIPLRSMTTLKYNEIFSVNVFSGFELAKIISKKNYINDAGGSFVFISSIMGMVGQPGKIGYCASKGALLAGSRAMALELAAKKIRVNCVCPSIVETEMTEKLFQGLPEESKQEIIKMHPLGLGKPEDVASAALFLLSDTSRWITGSQLVVDGGYSAS